MKCAGHSYAFPAHHKPLQSSKRLRTMRRRSFAGWALLSEVVIGSVEPTMFFALIVECDGKDTKFPQINGGNGQKSLKLAEK